MNKHQAKITKIQRVDEELWTVILTPLMGCEIGMCNLDIDALEAGRLVSDGEENGTFWLNFWNQPELKVGDILTEDEPIIAESAEGDIEEVELRLGTGGLLNWHEENPGELDVR